MSGTKRQLEQALPFAMEPVVYDFAINERGAYAELLTGDATMDEIVLPGPGGLKVVCGGSGIAGLADLKSDFVAFLGRELQKMGTQFDAIVIDTAAGIAAHVLHFVRLADQVAVVATPQLASTLDAYSLIKVARQEQVPGRLGSQLFDQRSILRHITACGALGAHQALVLQLGKRPLHGVGVDPGGGGKVAHRVQMPAGWVNAC